MAYGPDVPVIRLRGRREVTKFLASLCQDASR